jgi:glycosyltransferase involved in cell wall biosynthesis
MHLSALLRSRVAAGAGHFSIKGLADPALPPPPEDLAALCDEVFLASAVPLPREPAIYLDGSPMTHESTRTIRFLGRADVLCVAVIYDFIQLERPGYLPDSRSRIEFLLRLRRLRNFDVFCPISEFSARRSRELLSVPAERVHVTGASVRESLFPSERPSAEIQSNRFNHFGKHPYFLTVGGDDRRKNTEAAVRAVAQLSRSSKRLMRLLVLSHHDPAYRRDLVALGEGMGGQNVVEFHTSLSDDDLREAYAGAQCVIAPSYIEGFSLPVAEAAANGAPVIASDCAAHRELVEDADARFPADDTAALIRCLVRVTTAPEFREHLVRRQYPMAQRFREDKVAGRFWQAVVESFARREERSRWPAISRSRKPNVAFVTPFPPERSGIAPYSAQTIAALADHLQADVYTNAPRPLHLPSGVEDMGKIGPRPYVDRRYQAVVSVIGNSHYHLPIFKEYERFGGSCILHDSRLTQFYNWRLGRAEFTQLAKKTIGRDVSKAEIETWLRDEEGPSLFIEDVISKAQPLIVHSDGFRRIIDERHGVVARVAPFCPNTRFGIEECSEPSRRRARERIGVSKSVFLISSFGYVDALRKGIDHCVMALGLLRSWNVQAELHLVGKMEEGDRQRLGPLMRRAGVFDPVRVFDGFVDHDVYRDYLLASDAAVQLRTYGWGQPSAALADVIGAGIPAVANSELAESCDAPSYVRRIAPRFSGLIIAEPLLEIFQAGREHAWEEERRQYLESHSFRSYAERLVEFLEVS